MDTIRLVKDGGMVSEQTFDVRVTAGKSSAVGTQAGYREDYDIGGNSEQIFTIRPDQQYLPIAININDDYSVTGTQTADLVSARSLSSISYDTPALHPSTTIFILDNHGGFI